MEDIINLTLVINWCVICKLRRSLSLITCCSIESRYPIPVKSYWFLSFAKNIGENINNEFSG